MQAWRLHLIELVWQPSKAWWIFCHSPTDPCSSSLGELWDRVMLCTCFIPVMFYGRHIGWIYWSWQGVGCSLLMLCSDYVRTGIVVLRLEQVLVGERQNILQAFLACQDECAGLCQLQPHAILTRRTFVCGVNGWKPWSAQDNVWFCFSFMHSVEEWWNFVMKQRICF